MTTNVIAVTQKEPVYSGLVSVNREEDGSVTMIVRQKPRKCEGVRVCGHSCFPGEAGCNNYCNFDPARPMAAKPEPITIVDAGRAVWLNIAAEDWDAAIAGLLAG